MFKNCVFSLLFILLVSCDSNAVFSEYRSLPGGWNKGESIAFSFPAPDTLKPYNLFINLRNDESYEFSNLFLITHFNYPNGDIISDTLEYRMAAPDGKWLGKGFGAVKESKLWYKEDHTFPVSGTYEVQIEHAMRINGRVEGITSLSGIKDIGLKMENARKE